MPSMNTSRIAALALVTLIAAGCATTSSRPLRSEFEDIPIPKGLAYVGDRSTVIESPTVKAARLIYRGRIEVISLGIAIRTTLEANGWRNLSATTGQDTVQIYEKAGNSLQVRLWEGWYYTYVEMTASRAMPAAQTAPATQASQGIK
jgi:hypothetical protein